MKRQIVTNTGTARPDLLRTETLDGKTFLVSPVTPVVEGAHNGEFLSYDEITVFVDAWNGRLLPIDHPKDANGEPATAGSPAVMENSVVGFLFNVVAREDIRGISGELWIDIEKAAKVPGGTESVTRLQSGQGLEVSTAYYCFVDNVKGEWRNPRTGETEKYTSSQNQIRPDHLALLPFDLGACSWEDGCGAPRVNAANDVGARAGGDHAVGSLSTKEITVPMELNNKDKKDIKLRLKKIKTNGEQLENALTSAIETNVGPNETATQLINRLAAACGIDSTRMKSLIAGELDFVPRNWLVIIASVLDVDPWDLFSASSSDNMDARYGIEDDNDLSMNSSATQNNSTDNGTTVTIPNNELETSSEKPCAPCQKSLKTKILEILQSLGLKGTEIKEGNNEMATNADAKKAKVDALIASKLNQFTETNREWLIALSDDQLAVLEPVPVAAIVTEPVVETATNVQVVKPAEAVVVPAAVAAPVSKEAILSALGIDESVLTAVKAVNEQKVATRNSKIADILALPNCVYAENDLKAMSDSTLDKTAEMLQPQHPFRVTPGRKDNNEVVIPAPPSVLLAPPGVRGVDYATQTTQNHRRGVN